MSAGDALRGIVLRAARPEDDPFLLLLYATTRQAELERLPWSHAEKAAFVRMQFDAQHADYQSRYPAARFDVIESSGERIGRLYVDVRASEIRVLDVALLPAHRGRGVGTALMRDLLDEAATGGRDVTLHVEPANPAVRLYARLGFVVESENGPYQLMRWSPT